MSLADFRKEIDLIDQELVQLLEKRFLIVHQIGLLKKELGLPVFDPKREKEVLESKGKLITNKEHLAYYESIFKLIMDISKDMEK